MRSVKFKKIDAFASESSSGNPAAAVYLDSLDDLSSEEMLQIAKELRGFVSEVGYVSPGLDTDYQLRYFSSEREVDFCGHATIAILNDLVASSDSIQKTETLTIATNTERLEVENRYSSEKRVYISAPAAAFSSTEVSQAEIIIALGCATDDLNPRLPIEVVNAGLDTLIVPMAGLDSILSVNPDVESLKQYCLGIGVDIIILYSDETKNQQCGFRTRVFAPTFGYLEDPATGSGNAALGYYLLKHNFWNGKATSIEQNGSRDSPNFLSIFAKEDENNCRVWFGGGAVLKIDGEYSFR